MRRHRYFHTQAAPDSHPMLVAMQNRRSRFGVGCGMLRAALPFGKQGAERAGLQNFPAGRAGPEPGFEILCRVQAVR